MKKQTRILTLLLSVLLTATLLASCNPPADVAPASSTPPAASPSPAEPSPAPEAPQDEAKEAPMLAAKVASGELPPLEERMPKAADIMVEPMDSIGAYGDSLTMDFRGKEEQWTVGKATEENLFRFNSKGELEPNVAKGYDVNADSTEFIIYLREGMRWSDGEPFTADDCVFFYEHMCIPKAFGKSLWDCFFSTNPETKEKTQCTMEVLNDTSFKVTFADPSPNFPEKLAINGKWCYAPRHWYEPLLPEFIGEEAAEAKAKEMGYSDVTAMGLETGYYYWNVVGRPTLRPWVATNDIDGNLFIMERNPYYWKTDADGKQLPYLDTFQFVRISEPNQKVLNTMSGSSDIAFELPYSSIVPLKENETQSGYHLVQWGTSWWASDNAALQFNQTAQDDNLRALFQNKAFRQAMSIAADRKEMVQLVVDGFALPLQTSPAEGSHGYDKEWSEKWTEYDPEGAKKLLEEECGLVMGSDGYYTFADGSPLSFEILTYDEKEATAKAAELLTEKYFKEIGIKATFALRDRSLIEEMLKANEVNATISPVAPMETINITLRPDTLIPVRNYAAWYGTYGNWYATGGEEGMEPTGDVKTLLELYDDMLSATTKDEIEAIGQKLLAIHKENIWQIGYFSATPLLLAVSDDLQNFPEHEIWADEFRGPGIAHLQNVYFASDKA